MYELVSSASNSALAAFTLKAHPYTDCAYRRICGFQIGSEWRLVVSFENKAEFDMNKGAFSELYRVPPLSTDMKPTTLLVVRPGVLCVNSDMQNPD